MTLNKLSCVNKIAKLVVDKKVNLRVLYVVYQKMMDVHCTNAK